MNLVLAVTTLNRVKYLEDCLSTWAATRSPLHSWKVIVADDGSSDGTLEYLRGQQCHLIQNRGAGINGQTNTLLSTLATMEFDVCFKVDDDTVFKHSGWDEHYLEAMQRSGFSHLVFTPEAQRRRHPVFANGVRSITESLSVQGSFYTLTPAIIQTVGYFDTWAFGRNGNGHTDYTRRCCRAGFNSLDGPFDAPDSNNFIGAKHFYNHAGYASVLPHDRTCDWSYPENFWGYWADETYRRSFADYSDSRLYVPIDHKGIKLW